MEFQFSTTSFWTTTSEFVLTSRVVFLGRFPACAFRQILKPPPLLFEPPQTLLKPRRWNLHPHLGFLLGCFFLRRRYISHRNTHKTLNGTVYQDYQVGGTCPKILVNLEKNLQGLKIHGKKITLQRHLCRCLQPIHRLKKWPWPL